MSANIRDIGLGFDANQVLKLPSAKAERIKLVRLVNGFVEEDVATKTEQAAVPRPKGYVLEKLEADANALRESHFR